MPRTTLKQLTEKMMAYGQRFPEVTVGHPWGETTLQVRGKNFLFLRHEGDELSFSVKLPRSAVAALALPFVKPTEYGLGRHGWVTCRLTTVPNSGSMPRVARRELRRRRAKEARRDGRDGGQEIARLSSRSIHSHFLRPSGHSLTKDQLPGRRSSSRVSIRQRPACRRSTMTRSFSIPY